MVELQAPTELGLDGTTRELLVQTSEAVAELNSHRPFSDHVVDRLRREFLPDRVVATLSIEGIVATRRQTLAVMDAIKVNESIGKGEVEIRNILRGDEYVLECVDGDATLTASLIREINTLVLKDLALEIGVAGEFRSHDVELPGAPIPPPTAIAVKPLVGQFFEMLAVAGDLHPVLQAAWAHAQLAQIHPFADGNGRTCRLVQDMILLKNGFLPVGIPSHLRDDYYSALASADQGRWSDLVELIALQEQSAITKALAIIREPEKRAEWIQKLSRAASSKKENSLHKQYVVWRQRMESASKSFVVAAKELDASSDVIGAEVREFGVVDFDEWRTICERGYTQSTWLFSVLCFLDRKPFYKSIIYLRRHKPRTECDPFGPRRDLVGAFFTGVEADSDERPDFRSYADPHILLREFLFDGQDLLLYQQPDPGTDAWNCESVASADDVAKEYFMAVFARKAGLGS